MIAQAILRSQNIKKRLLITAALLTTLATSLIAIHSTSASSAPTASNWWPTNNTSISGIQPFKGVLNGWNVNDYAMYWSVDGGQLNPMPTNYTDTPHKEADVNVSGWNWQSNNTYSIAYVAKNNNGTELARVTFSVIIPTSNSSAATTSTAATTSPTITSSTPTATSTAITTTTAPAATNSPSNSQPAPSSGLQNLSLYVDPNSEAKQQADAWRTTRPADATSLDKIAAQAEAKWFGGWNTDVNADVNNYVTAAATQGTIPVLVAYNIPQRDCGGYSAGGTTPDGYINWIKAMAAGIGKRQALVVLEPDSIANLDCLSSSDQATRLALLSQAVSILKANATTHVYLDGGHPQWKSAEVIGSRLKQANISAADGFSLNISNFYTTADNITFGQAVSSYVGSKHYVIDTSRNGNGPTSDNQWCNPSGRALGNRPTTQTGNSMVDAYLWVKAPGESDGTCNGGPNAGAWWADYALGLAQRAGY